MVEVVLRGTALDINYRSLRGYADYRPWSEANEIAAYNLARPNVRDYWNGIILAARSWHDSIVDQADAHSYRGGMYLKIPKLQGTLKWAKLVLTINDMISVENAETVDIFAVKPAGTVWGDITVSGLADVTKGATYLLGQSTVRNGAMGKAEMMLGPYGLAWFKYYASQYYNYTAFFGLRCAIDYFNDPSGTYPECWLDFSGASAYIDFCIDHKPPRASLVPPACPIRYDAPMTIDGITTLYDGATLADGEWIVSPTMPYYAGWNYISIPTGSFVQGQVYQVKWRFQDSFGLWSNWAECFFSIEGTPSLSVAFDAEAYINDAVRMNANVVVGNGNSQGWTIYWNDLTTGTFLGTGGSIDPTFTTLGIHNIHVTATKSGESNLDWDGPITIIADPVPPVQPEIPGASATARKALWPIPSSVRIGDDRNQRNIYGRK